MSFYKVCVFHAIPPDFICIFKKDFRIGLFLDPFLSTQERLFSDKDRLTKKASWCLSSLLRQSGLKCLYDGGGYQ